MKVAVTYENGQIFQHFGHSESFKIYETEGKNIVRAEIIGTDGAGHSALAAVLKDKGVNVPQPPPQPPQPLPQSDSPSSLPQCPQPDSSSSWLPQCPQP